MGVKALSHVLVATLVSAALVVGGTTTAQAAPPPTPGDAVASSTTTPGLIPVKAITDQGYSLADVEAAIANSPYLSLVQAPVVTGHGGITPQGVTFGTFIYIRCNQRTAKALQQADIGTAIVILGLATGGIGLVIATAVYLFMGSINDSYLNQCANWEFHLTYPTPWSTSQVVYAGCYNP